MREGWYSKRFDEVFDLQMGKTPARDNPTFWGGNNTWVSIADLKDLKYISSSKEQISDAAVEESGIKVVKKGTAIMSFKLSIGKAAIADKDLYTNEAIMSFKVKDGFEIRPDYIYYFLKGFKWAGTNKAVMGLTLNKKAIAQNYFSFPPIQEQEKIVAELDCLTYIIEKKKEQLKELDNLSQSIFYDMFGDPITNEKGWETKRVGEIADITDYVANGSFASLRENVSYKNEKDFAILVRLADFSNGFDASKFIYIDEHAYNFLAKSKLFGGEIIMSNVGSIGKLFLCPDLGMPMSLAPNTIVIKTSNNRFFSSLFACDQFQKKITTISSQTALPKFNKTEFKKIVVPVPTIELQNEFADKIEEIERQKGLIKKSIAETETLFNSRMDYWFN